MAVSASIPARPRRPAFALLGDVNASNIATALTVVLFYAFGPAPFYLAASGHLAADRTLALSGFAVVFATAGSATILLALAYRQPIALGWSLPSLVYMVAMAPRYSIEEMAGATLVAGLAVVFIAIAGLGDRITRAVPLPVVMAVFAGSALDYCAGTFSALGQAPLVVAPPVVGFFAARAMGRPWLPPLAGALLVGLPLLVVQGELAPVSAALELPRVVPLMPAFDAGSILALSLPLVIVTVGMGNAQGIGLLASRGYDVPARTVTVATGTLSMFHALFGAPPSAIQTSALALMSGDEAGPAPARYVAAIVASLGAILIAVAAAPVAAVAAALPAPFTSALIGLVLLSVVLEALRKALEGPSPTPAFLAFVIAGSSLSIGGIGATFWALVAGAAAAHTLSSTPERSR